VTRAEETMCRYPLGLKLIQCYPHIIDYFWSKIAIGASNVGHFPYSIPLFFAKVIVPDVFPRISAQVIIQAHGKARLCDTITHCFTPIRGPFLTVLLSSRTTKSDQASRCPCYGAFTRARAPDLSSSSLFARTELLRQHGPLPFLALAGGAVLMIAVAPLASALRYIPVTPRPG
jgi:hypothetical protein